MWTLNEQQNKELFTIRIPKILLFPYKYYTTLSKFKESFCFETIKYKEVRLQNKELIS